MDKSNNKSIRGEGEGEGGGGGGGEKDGEGEEIKWKETKDVQAGDTKPPKFCFFPTGRLDETTFKELGNRRQHSARASVPRFLSRVRACARARLRVSALSLT